MAEDAYPTCTSAACRSRAPALLLTSVGIGLVAGLMVQSVLGLAAPVALGVLLAGACCARRRLAAGQPLPFGRGSLMAAAAAYVIGGFALTVAVDVLDPGFTVDTVVVGGLWLCGGTAGAALTLGTVWLRRRLRRPSPAQVTGLPAAPAE
jgi:hypothetical protein